MQAVILAGGKGTRLRPLSASLPKPLVPVGDYPILEILLRRLAKQGFRDVVLCVGHLAELVMAFCGDGKRWGLKIRYVREEKPLHTAGALRLVRGLAPHFLVVNGDILTTLDFRALMRRHARRGGWATLAVCPREARIDYGVVRLHGDESLEAYIEKPVIPYLVSMGINVFDRRAVGLIRRGEHIGIPDFALRIQKAGKPVHGFRTDAEWLDIGRLEDYEAAQDLFAGDPRRFLR